MTSSDGEGQAPLGAPPDPQRGTPPGTPETQPGAAPPASSGASAGPPASYAPVLAQGYLHPGILFLRLATSLRGTILPILVAVFLMEGNLQLGIIAISIFMLVMNMGYALIRFVTFRYWLTTDELVTTEGIFNRQERRIPVNRVQDLSFEQTLVRRFFGLVVVTVETASGEGAEARLDSLGLRPAAQLREAMLYIRSQRPAAPIMTEDGELLPPAAVVQEPDQVLFRVRAWDLTLRGLTDNRAGAIIIGLFVLAEQADQVGALSFITNIVDLVWKYLAGLDFTVAVLVGVATLLLVVILGWVVSIAAAFLLFHGFTLVRRGEVFQRRYGLLTTRVRSLPKRKIQRVLMEQSLLRRIFRLVVVRADSAGSGANQKEEMKGGLDVVAPMTKLVTGRLLVPHLLPGMNPHGMAWQRVSSKVVTRLFAEGCVLTVIAFAAFPFLGWLALIALLWPVIMLGTGILIFHNLGYSHVTGHFAMRWGVFGRYRAFIPLHKVQAVALRAGPWDRLFGLARLVVYVAGAAPTTLQHLTRADAERLQHDLALTAAHSKFVW